MGGPSASRLTVAGTSPRTGFETTIVVPPGYRRFKVEALDGNGRVIGTSAPFASRN
jgi:hypothetical protein